MFHVKPSACVAGMPEGRQSSRVHSLHNGGMTTDVLLLGSGDLGTRIGLDFVAAGCRVTAIRRHAELLPSQFHGVSADLEDGLPDLPAMAGAGGGPHILVAVLTAGARDAKAYQRVFGENLQRVLQQARGRGWAPRRAVFVSSTAVCAPSGDVDETTPAAPASDTGLQLLAAEQQFMTAFSAETEAMVVRPSGIYGPGRTFFVDQVRAGTVRDPQRMTHRIHRDDAARAIVHLSTTAQACHELYLLTDDLPARADEVADFLAGQLRRRGEAADYQAKGVEQHGDSGEVPPRVLSNRRLRQSGFEFAYPTFREGYVALLDGVGERYP